MLNENVISVIELFSLSIETFKPLLTKKLNCSSRFFNLMDENEGRIPYPAPVLEYFAKLEVTHWAEYYLPAKLAALEKNDNLEHFIRACFVNELGENPDVQQLISISRRLILEYAASAPNMQELEFLSLLLDSSELNSLSEEEKVHRKEVWLFFLVTFYNDLSIATHGESITHLIEKATINNDETALVKAIQIDPTIIPYFEQTISEKYLKGDSNFFDLFSYRLKNSPRRGVINHPLLWILLSNLFTLGCLRKEVSNKEILDLYNEGVKEQPQYLIDDEQTVRRQRRKFLQKYRPKK